MESSSPPIHLYNPTMPVTKKNLGGGKNFKKQGSKGRRGERQNQEIASAFVEDVLSGDIPKDIVVARVTKMFGGGRLQLLLPSGVTQVAAIRGALTVSAGAARAPGNVLAITPNTFVLLQLTDYGAQVAAIMNRGQIHQVKDKIEAGRGFFAIGEATEEDDGFDWDVEEEGADTKLPAADRAQKGEDEINIDAI